MRFRLIRFSIDLKKIYEVIRLFISDAHHYTFLTRYSIVSRIHKSSYMIGIQYIYIYVIYICNIMYV